MEAFLEREKERYRSQFEQYDEALAHDEGAMPGFYFPLLAGWLEWGA